jgi:GTP-binding protein Era
MSSSPPICSPPPSASEPSGTVPDSSRCGYVALIGRPNAGKSTLFNAFVGQRLSIVTPRPQTTRSRILGILTRPASQMILMDTPGLLDPSYKLHEFMVQQIDLAARGADVVLLLLDASRPRDRSELVRDFLRRNRVLLVTVLNKVDLLPVEQVDATVAALQEEFGLALLLPISALRGDHAGALLERLEALLPLGDRLYPEEMVAEQPERFFAAEFIREAAFLNLREELPYSLSVSIEEFSEHGQKTFIRAIVYVERESQKGIVIGHRGENLGRIGRQARLQIEALIDAPVYLELRVKVRPDWRNRDRDLREFGYR